MHRTIAIAALLAAAPLLPAQQAPAPAAGEVLSCDDEKLEAALADLKKEAQEQNSPRAARQVYLRYDFAGHRPQAEAWAQRFVSMLTEMAGRGNVNAMMNLAYLYLQGDPVVPADREKALVWLKAAEAGENAGACILLAHVYAADNDMQGVNASYRHAFAIYEKRAAAGDVKAKLAMADLLFNGLGVQEDRDRAVDIYKELAKHDDPTALSELFRIFSTYSKSEAGTRKAFEYARRLADLGDTRMAYLMYCELKRGRYMDKDEEAAAKYLEASLKEPSPFPEALYQKGWDAETAGNNAEAILFYERAVQLNHDRARTRLGLLWLHGAQGDEGRERGRVLLEESATTYNSPFSAYELARHYAQTGDSAKADDWYIKSSERGYAPAMARRGLLHLNPFSPVEWSPTLAYRWWKQGERGQDPTCTRYLNLYLYLFIPLLVVLVFTLPLLILRKAKRKQRGADPTPRP